MRLFLLVVKTRNFLCHNLRFSFDSAYSLAVDVTKEAYQIRGFYKEKIIILKLLRLSSDRLRSLHSTMVSLANLISRNQPPGLSLTWGWPEVLSMDPIVQILDRWVWPELFSLSLSRLHITSENQWVIGKLSSDQKRYIDENETEKKGATRGQDSGRRTSG